MYRYCTCVHSIGLPHDALPIVDVQNDFLPAGSLAVPAGDEVIAALNRYLALFARSHLPVYATRDWHPATHRSFTLFGGLWPPHCIAGSRGAELPAALQLTADTIGISEAAELDQDALSGFDSTDLAERLHATGVSCLFIGGLATDYCVLNTVSGALQKQFDVMLLIDAIRAVELCPGDGDTGVIT